MGDAKRSISVANSLGEPHRPQRAPHPARHQRQSRQKPGMLYAFRFQPRTVLHGGMSTAMSHIFADENRRFRYAHAVTVAIMDIALPGSPRARPRSRNIVRIDCAMRTKAKSSDSLS